MEKTITILLSEENAKHLESFLQGFMATHKFQPPNAGNEIRAFNQLYTRLREGLDAAGSK